jgi:hypothetical protein
LPDQVSILCLQVSYSLFKTSTAPFVVGIFSTFLQLRYAGGLYPPAALAYQGGSACQTQALLHLRPRNRRTFPPQADHLGEEGIYRFIQGCAP